MRKGIFQREYNIDAYFAHLLKDIIVDKLEKRKAENIEVSDNIISYKNDFFTHIKSNFSLMSLVDSGSFFFYRKGEQGILLASFSMARLIIFDLIAIVVLYSLNFMPNLGILIFSGILFLISLISILRYHSFMKDIIEEYSKQVDSKLA